MEAVTETQTKPECVCVCAYCRCSSPQVYLRHRHRHHCPPGLQELSAQCCRPTTRRTKSTHLLLSVMTVKGFQPPTLIKYISQVNFSET